MNRNERVKNLVDFIRQENNQFKTGELQSLTQRSDLAQRFGYRDNSGVLYVLKTYGLLEERNTLEKQSKRVEISVSNESAWMLGVLAGGAYIKTTIPIACSINSGEKDNEFIEKFIPIGEHFFQTNAYISYGNSEERRSATKDVRFYNANVISSLGDLRRDYWKETVQTRFDWILQNSQYSWSFLEGLFERTGNIGKRVIDKGGRLQLEFFTKNLNNATFLIELLVNLGISEPAISYEDIKKQKIRSIKITNIADMKIFANHIHSIVPEREELLKAYRQLDPEKERDTKQVSDEEALKEYEYLVRVLGPNLTLSQIDRLRRDNRTKYSSGIYRRFGNGVFLIAQENLKRRLAERENQEPQVVNEQYEQIQETELEMYRKLSERLVSFVQQEMEQYKEGAIQNVSSPRELVARFGYAFSASVNKALKKAGILEEYRDVLEQSKKREIAMSYESAWVMGVLAGEGWIENDSSYCLRMMQGDNNEKKKFIEKFIPKGETFFQTKARLSSPEQLKTSDTQLVRFYNSKIIALLGDFTAGMWSETIKVKHSWILSDPQYSWALLEGLFEARGTVKSSGNASRKVIGFFTTNSNAAFFIKELLNQLGIERSYISYKNKSHQVPTGVFITNTIDIYKFASHIHSLILEKEKILEIYRNSDISAARSPLNFGTDEDLLAEYEKLIHIPDSKLTLHDINHLRKVGKTKYSANVYGRRFGSGSFSAARENMRRILAEREDIKDYSD